MPRKPRIYEVTGKPFRKDMELVIGAQAGDEACYKELWEKFFLLRQKEKFSFINWCKANKIDYSTSQDYIESWDADAWEKFRAQMPGIRIAELQSKGYNNDNWGITIRLKAYLEVVNRTYANRIMKKLKNEVSATKVFNSDENDEADLFDTIAVAENPMKPMALDVFRSSYQKMLKDLDETQMKVLTLKSEKKSVTSIMNELGLKRSEANKAIAFAKKRLEHHIKASSKKMGIPMTYADLVTLIE
jgi:hypothetical protein